MIGCECCHFATLNFQVMDQSNNFKWLYIKSQKRETTRFYGPSVRIEQYTYELFLQKNLQTKLNWIKPLYPTTNAWET